MLDTFTPDQRASIVVQIMKEENQGASLRDCCKAQGITVQTFLDWRARARRHNQFDTLHAHNGPRTHPERQKPKERPKTALELAFETAQVRTYPSDNPEDLHALEHGEPPAPIDSPVTIEAAPEPAPPPVEATPLPEPKQADSGPVEPQILPLEEPMPKRKCPDYSQGARGVAAAMYAANPFLRELDQKTFEALGERPDKSQSGPYNKWIAHRKTLMSPEQVKQFEAFFGGPRKGIPKAKGIEKPVAHKPPSKKARQEQLDMLAARANPETVEPAVEPAVVMSNGKPMGQQVRSLVAQHAEVSSAIANHEETGFTMVRVKMPRDMPGLASENERLKRALTALTLENLQLRGVL